MRTTLSLDDEVAERLQQEVETSKRPFKQVVNDALRRGLSMTAPQRPRRYRVRSHASAFQPGIDPGKLNQLADELEADSFRQKQR